MIPIRYNIRSLLRRRTTTAATALGIALVVFVASAASMLASGIRQTLVSSGEDDTAIVIRKGSDGELASVIEQQRVLLVLTAQGVATHEGRPLGAAELLVVTGMHKIGAEGLATVAVRGISDGSFALRPALTLAAGRRPRTGTNEVIIGKRLQGRFRGLELGQSFEFTRNRPVQVVGVFASGGSAYESEIWADLGLVRAAFGRQGLVSSVRVRLSGSAAFAGFRQAIEHDKRLTLQAYPERTFFEKQSEGTSAFIGAIGTIVSVFFSIAAMLGAMITMNATISKRQREIGTLRALGFSRSSVLLSFVAESCALAFVGGVVGALASLALSFVKIPMMNYASWSEMVFEFRPSAGGILGAVLAAVAVGFIGGFIPALRAARMPTLSAVRE